MVHKTKQTIQESDCPELEPEGKGGSCCLENVLMDIRVPTSFLYLREILLSNTSNFWVNDVLQDALHFKNISRGEWDRNNTEIGMPEHDTTGTNLKSFIGATRKIEYIMPKTALVGENMAHETSVLTEYTDQCFKIKMTTLTPDVPFGKRFTSITQIVVKKVSDTQCRFMASVEPDFPNGKPLVGKQIKKGMIKGSGQFYQEVSKAILAHVSIKG